MLVTSGWYYYLKWKIGVLLDLDTVIHCDQLTKLPSVLWF